VETVSLGKPARSTSSTRQPVLASRAASTAPAQRARLARLLPAVGSGAAEPPGPQDQELDRFRLLEAVAALLAELARSTPLLLVLEDLHWADRATLAMLLHLARSPVRAPLLVLVTCREDGQEAARSLAHALTELRRQRLAEFMTVRALDRHEVESLVAGHVGRRPPVRFAAAIGRATDGNPFFVEELLRHLLETGAIDPATSRWPEAAAVEQLDVPEGVREVLAQRPGPPARPDRRTPAGCRSARPRVRVHPARPHDRLGRRGDRGGGGRGAAGRPS